MKNIQSGNNFRQRESNLITLSAGWKNISLQCRVTRKWRIENTGRALNCGWLVFFKTASTYGFDSLIISEASTLVGIAEHLVRSSFVYGKFERHLVTMMLVNNFLFYFYIKRTCLKRRLYQLAQHSHLGTDKRPEDADICVKKATFFPA